MMASPKQKETEQAQIKKQKPLINFLTEIIKFDCRHLETRSDELWDKDAPYNQTLPTLKERWPILKNMKLKDCNFETPSVIQDSEYSYFIITDTSSGKFLLLSNRVSNNELRGARLKNELIARQKDHPDESVYDALQFISAQKFNMAEKYRSIATDQEAIYNPPISAPEGIAMTDFHYAIFTATLRQELLQTNDPQSATINADDIYQRTLQLAEAIDQSIASIHKKQDDLKKRNEMLIVNLLQELEMKLNVEKADLCSGKIDLSQFAVNCENHISETENKQGLQDQRKTLGRFQAQSSRILKELGVTKETKPATNDTMKRIATLKKTIKDLKQSAIPMTEENKPAIK